MTASRFCSLSQSLVRVVVFYLITSPFLPSKPMTISEGVLKVQNPQTASVQFKGCSEKQFYIPQVLSGWDNSNKMIFSSTASQAISSNLQATKSSDFNTIERAIHVTVGANNQRTNLWAYEYESRASKQDKSPGLSDTDVIYCSWDNSEYQASAKASTFNSTLISMEAKLTNVGHTIPYFNSISPTTFAIEVQSTSTHKFPISSMTPIDFSRPSYLSPITNSKESGFSTDSTWGHTISWFSDRGNNTSIKNPDILPWTYRPSSSYVGITVVPSLVSSLVISTFFGSLGLARTKAYVIPVDTDGVPGWHKRSFEKNKVVAVVGNKTNTNFAISTIVIDSQRPTLRAINGLVIPTLALSEKFSGRYQVASTISNKPTSVSNMTFNDSLKFAAIQTFSQIGIVFITILIILGLVVIFVCIGSILRFPMRCFHKLRYGDINKPTEVMPSKSQKTSTHDTMITEVISYDTLNPYTMTRYLRGTAEAIDSDRSFQETSNISDENIEGGSMQEVGLATVMLKQENNSTDENALKLAVLSSGSQSKLTGGRLRRTSSC